MKLIEADSFPETSGSIWKGGYSSTLSRGRGVNTVHPIHHWTLDVFGGRLTHEATVSVNTTAPRLLEKWSGRVQRFNFFFEGGRWWTGVWTHKYLFEKALIKRVQNTNPHEVFWGFWKTREKDLFWLILHLLCLRSDVPPRWLHSWLLHLETHAPSVTRPWTYVTVKKAVADYLCFFLYPKTHRQKVDFSCRLVLFREGQDHEWMSINHPGMVGVRLEESFRRCRCLSSAVVIKWPAPNKRT